MADYSDIATSGRASLNNIAAGGLIEEYEIDGRRRKNGKFIDLVKGVAMADALAARQSRGSLLSVAKTQAPE